MPIDPRNKGQFIQAATPHFIPKIAGSFLSVDGMVDFNTNYEKADYPVLYAQLGDTYNDGTTGPTQFKTPSRSDWGLPEIKTETFTPSITVNIYDKTVYDAAKVWGVISDGTAKEFLDITIIDDGTDTGIDVVSIGVDNKYLDLTITAGISGNNVQLSIVEAVSIETIEFVYSVYPMPDNRDGKFMVRF